jgi:hypothetical protein
MPVNLYSCHGMYYRDHAACPVCLKPGRLCVEDVETTHALIPGSGNLVSRSVYGHELRSHVPCRPEATALRVSVSTDPSQVTCQRCLNGR